MGNWSQNIINKDWKKNATKNVTKKRTLSPRENATELGNTLYFPLGSQKLVTSPTQKTDVYLTLKNSQHLVEKNPYKKPTDQTRSVATS